MSINIEQQILDTSKENWEKGGATCKTNNQNNFGSQASVDPIHTDEAKIQLNQCREEYSVEIRESKRNQILKKNRIQGLEESKQENVFDEAKALEGFQDLQTIQISSQEEFKSFMQKYLTPQISQQSEHQKDQCVTALISALTSQCSPQFFILASYELSQYFEDEDPEKNITIKDIYRSIDIILKTQFVFKAKLILNDWTTALCHQQQQQQQQISFFSNIVRVDAQLARNCLIACLKVLSCISRGSDQHCSVFEKYDFLQVLFDIFDATKTERDFLEVMLYAIGNIAATRDSWRIFFMQKNFHNTIFTQLQIIPKNNENLVLHRRICWCLSNFSRDFVNLSQNRDSLQFTSNGQVLPTIQDMLTFDFSQIKNLFDTFLQYEDAEIRSDISWAASQLITIFFSETKSHPQLINCVVKTNNSEVLNFNGNAQLTQLYNQITTEKIGFLIQSNICDYINLILPQPDMAILIPTLRILNKLMTGCSEVLEVFFSKCNEVLTKNLVKHLQNPVSAIRRETVKTIHYIFLCDFERQKQLWFTKFLPVILSRFNIEMYTIKEEVFKLLNSIIDKVTPQHFEILVFKQNNYDVIKTMKNALLSYETKPEGIITILNTLFKIINYYKLGNSIEDSQKIKRIIQIFEQNNIPQLIEELQEHQSQGIFVLTQEFIQLYNSIHDITMDEEQREEKSNDKQKQQPYIQQDYLRYNAQKNIYENIEIEKNHEEQKI